MNLAFEINLALSLLLLLTSAAAAVCVWLLGRHHGCRGQGRMAGEWMVLVSKRGVVQFVAELLYSWARVRDPCDN